MSKTGLSQNTKKIEYMLLFLIIMGTVPFFTFSKYSNSSPLSKRVDLTYADIARGIKAKYDQNLAGFSDYKASHYANRIYRISGDEAYLKYNLLDLKSMTKQVELLLSLADKNNEKEFSKQLQLNEWPSSGARESLRRESLNLAPSFPYYLRSLNILRRAMDYRVCSSQFEQLKNHVLAYDYTHDLSDPAMIRAWAAQLANVVAWIKQIGGKDYSEIFVNALQQVYPDSNDQFLSAKQYENKLYALTHIVLAGSQYYQYPVSRHDYAWVFDYFDRQIDTILSRVKADVVAEVGIAYMLAGEFNNPAFEKTRQNIARQYNEVHQMIPNYFGRFNITTGSHRNILAIILLSSPEKFHPGPWLNPASEEISLPEDVHQCVPSQHYLAVQ